MSKGLEALKDFKSQQTGVNVYANEYLDIIEKELKALEIIKNHLSERVANVEGGKPQKCLLMLIMENEENYDLLKEVLL